MISIINKIINKIIKKIYRKYTFVKINKILPYLHECCCIISQLSLYVQNLYF